MAIETFGTEAQAHKCIAEMGELIVALSHNLEGRRSDGAVIEEIADVTIMCYQMAIIYGFDNVCSVIDTKLERLAKRISEARR